jgi:hypothetical protein
MKRDDDAAQPGSEVTASELTSVATGRSMERIAAGAARRRRAAG